jgi:hypothetical protein
VLRQAGHECWPSTAGLAASADDDAVAVYADDRGAVLITHDREFTRRRMRNTIGRHVRLDCEQPDAMAVIGAHLDELVAALERALCRAGCLGGWSDAARWTVGVDGTTRTTSAVRTAPALVFIRWRSQRSAGQFVRFSSRDSSAFVASRYQLLPVAAT